MKTSLWIIIMIVIAFLGFMMGYALPPFMEVGFGQGGDVTQGGTVSEEELEKQYQQMYQEGDTGATTE
ncbi:hypothetical protein BMS3Abin07_00360 [bacterium BMS3Abin07]|nr:hypothetical protein BMS3Abin07_00360 [bacterium BMS3Abin07]GBE32720.1 hypothetical protein BMS3Bbin05_01638 [bacterium BMS3Bbin05]HDL21286.1 hypothetical protein [Nitrospirota bacterium]HDO21983.1 hypothetical protein [Nitrospirota bacterium]HDZ87717.1 hypothetical protein [Nitrospirota bacterium]